jgi:hypothetical protein
MPDGICSVDGCEKPHRAAAYCVAHYSRLRRTGSLGSEPIKTYGQPKPQCSVDGCALPAKSHAQDMCDKHYTRARRHGDPNQVDIKPGDNISTIHKRLSKARGSATRYACVECGKPAKQWAYDNADPAEKWGLNNGCLCAYSLDMDHYQPMCASCHKRFDCKVKRSRQVSHAA